MNTPCRRTTTNFSCSSIGHRSSSQRRRALPRGSLPQPLRIVRTSIDSDKLPYYYPERDVQWPVGLWNWERQDRTWYALKGKAPSVGGRSKWTIVPRSLGSETNRQPRVSGQLDEICVMFKQKDDPALEIERLVHAL